MNIIFYISTLNLFMFLFLVYYKPLISLNKMLFLMCLVSFLISIQLKLFSDLVTIDYPIFLLRLLCVYNILSMCYNYRVLCKTILGLNINVDSLTKNFICSSWFERESWDLFGVYYLGNLDLRRILNDYGFLGHPLKKDFPLSGFWEISFSMYRSLVSYVNIKVVQSFRFFSIKSPWK